MDYEPVVSQHADLVIAVIGIDCVGKPLSDEYVHRSRRFGDLLDRAEGAPITTKDITNIFFHPSGYLKSVGPRTKVAIFISKVGSEAEREAAIELAAALRGADSDGRIERIVMGELGSQSHPRLWFTRKT